MQHSNVLFPPGGEALNAIGCLGGSLRHLYLLDLSNQVSQDALAALGSLSKVQMDFAPVCRMPKPRSSSCGPF